MKLDYIIVGQGIAGTLIAYFLLKENQKVLVVDKFDPLSSSNVAAGIINPVTGRKITKTWRAEEIIPFAKEVYNDLEQELNQKFFYKKKIVKLFSSKKEEEEWLAYLEKNGEDKYVKPFRKKKKYQPFINIGAGGVELRKGGYVDIRGLIFSFRKMLRDAGLLLEEKFEFDALEIKKKKIVYKDLEAAKVIFCEGYKGRENPYFQWLPFSVTKGELIEIRSEDLPQEKIFNKHYWILPTGDSKFKVGATYNWDEIDCVPSVEARELMLDKLHKIIKVPFEVTEHLAGIRPTVKDRRPLLGEHPEFAQLVMFNGLGSKGASLGPFFAHQLVQHLVHNKPIDKEVHVKRAEGWKSKV